MREITLQVGKRVVVVEVDSLDPKYFSMTTLSVDGKAPHKNYLNTTFHLDACDAVEEYLKALPKPKAPFLFPWFITFPLLALCAPLALAMWLYNYMVLKGGLEFLA